MLSTLLAPTVMRGGTPAIQVVVPGQALIALAPPLTISRESLPKVPDAGQFDTVNEVIVLFKVRAAFQPKLISILSVEELVTTG
jgi:hypothetical protein